MSGPFISDTFVPQVNRPEDVKLAAIAWGFTLGFGYLTCSKAVEQTRMVWKRSHRVTVYVALIWIEIVSSFIFGLLAWLLVDDSIPMNFYVLFSIVVVWSLEIQALLQIIINRVSLLIIDNTKATRITWGVAFIVTLVNISVFIIWIPARLQVNQRWININSIWDRAEKIIYLVIDACLNGYFLYLVHSKLVSAGLTKYRPLFRFNAFIVVISLSMDILIISMMNMKNSFLYTQFHPLAYMVKLNIELSMADLITKIAKQPGVIYGTSSRHTITLGDNAKEGQVSHSYVDGERGNPFVTSAHDESGRKPTYGAWIRGPHAQATAKHIEKKKEKERRRAGPVDLEELSESDGEGSLHAENPPAGDSGGRRIIVKTTEIAVTTESIDFRESIELSERNGAEQSEHGSTTVLNQGTDQQLQIQDLGPQLNMKSEI